MKNMKRLIGALMAVVLLITAFGLTAQAAGYDGEDFKAKVITESANVYKKMNGKKVGTLSKGAVVTVTGGKGGWAKVKRDGKVRYMKVKDLIAEAPVRIVQTIAKAQIFVIKGGSGWKIVPAGTTLYVYGKDANGHYLVGNHKMSRLGYIEKGKVI